MKFGKAMMLAAVGIRVRAKSWDPKCYAVLGGELTISFSNVNGERCHYAPMTYDIADRWERVPK